MLICVSRTGERADQIVEIIVVVRVVRECRSQRVEWNGKWNEISTIDNPSKWWQEQSCSRNTGLALVFGGVARGDTNSRSLGRSEGGAVDARIVTVLPACSPTAPGIPTKTSPLNHSAPVQPHRSGRTACGPYGNQYGRLATSSLHVDSFHIIHSPPTNRCCISHPVFR